jgi:hypothetical protein
MAARTRDCETNGWAAGGTARIALKFVGTLLVAGGVLLGGRFLWWLPDLVREVQEAAQGEHRALAVMGTLDPGAPTASSVLIGGVGGPALTLLGAVILRRAR